MPTDCTTPSYSLTAASTFTPHANLQKVIVFHVFPGNSRLCLQQVAAAVSFQNCTHYLESPCPHAVVAMPLCNHQTLAMYLWNPLIVSLVATVGIVVLAAAGWRHAHRRLDNRLDGANAIDADHAARRAADDEDVSNRTGLLVAGWVDVHHWDGVDGADGPGLPTPQPDSSALWHLGSNTLRLRRSDFEFTIAIGSMGEHELVVLGAGASSVVSNLLC